MASAVQAYLAAARQQHPAWQRLVTELLNVGVRSGTTSHPCLVHGRNSRRSLFVICTQHGTAEQRLAVVLLEFCPIGLLVLTSLLFHRPEPACCPVHTLPVALTVGLAQVCSRCCLRFCGVRSSVFGAAAPSISLLSQAVSECTQQPASAAAPSASAAAPLQQSVSSCWPPATSTAGHAAAAAAAMPMVASPSRDMAAAHAAQPQASMAILSTQQHAVCPLSCLRSRVQPSQRACWA